MEPIHPPIMIFAALLGTWFGAAVFYVAIIGPAAIQAGPSAAGFLQALARRYGTGPFYAMLAFLTVAIGIWTYVVDGMYQSAGARNLWTTLSVGLATLALLLGASANRTAERAWVKAVRSIQGAATADQGREVAAALAKTEKVNVATTVVLGLALLCVVLSQTLAY